MFLTYQYNDIELHLSKISKLFSTHMFISFFSDSILNFYDFVYVSFNSYHISNFPKSQ